MKCLKVPVKHDYMMGLKLLIEQHLQMTCIDDFDALIYASLYEVKVLIDKKMIDNIKPTYTLKLTPAQAIAMRLWVNEFIDLPTTNYMGNFLQQISNETHQKFLV